MTEEEEEEEERKKRRGRVGLEVMKRRGGRG